MIIFHVVCCAVSTNRRPPFKHPDSDVSRAKFTLLLLGDFCTTHPLKNVTRHFGRPFGMHKRRPQVEFATPWITFYLLLVLSSLLFSMATPVPKSEIGHCPVVSINNRILTIFSTLTAGFGEGNRQSWNRFLVFRHTSVHGWPLGLWPVTAGTVTLRRPSPSVMTVATRRFVRRRGASTRSSPPSPP